ncbi:hypothetical protein GCM10018955_54840 [Planomonospora venezuelensis]
MLGDARRRESGKEILITLVEHAMRTRLGGSPSAAPGRLETIR